MNLNKLSYWLQPKDKIFADFDSYVAGVNQTRRIFIDRGADVLFIAHLDTVLPPKLIKRTNKRIYARGLDDRLGCLVATELSQQLNADLLLTDYEETGKTTAWHHDCKPYNWIVEFDREGRDVVTYDLDSPDFRKALSNYWDIGIGSYSDIVTLETETCCMNLGIGYKHSHSKDSYVSLKILRSQIRKFLLFYHRYKDTKFEQSEHNYNKYTTYCDCELCGNYVSEYVHGHYICEDCFLLLLYDEHRVPF